eukprot:scaffold11000_cov39-Phaeocystis_antarctica.AAC.1
MAATAAAATEGEREANAQRIQAIANPNPSPNPNPHPNPDPNPNPNPNPDQALEEVLALELLQNESSPPSTPTSIAPSPPPPPPSRYLAEFIEGARLGKGGFGQVFRARNSLDAVEYAIKKVRLTGSERAQERAVREATCLAKLDHPNVVRYYQ